MEEQGQEETAAAGGARGEGLRQRGQVPHALARLPRPAAGEWRQSRRFLLRPTIFSPFAIFMPLYCFELFLLWVHRRLDCWIPRAIPLFRLLVLVILFCRGTGIQELHPIAWSLHLKLIQHLMQETEAKKKRLASTKRRNLALLAEVKYDSSSAPALWLHVTMLYHLVILHAGIITAFQLH